MKRMNLVLDEQLLEELTRVSGERTYSRAVTKVMEGYLRRHRAGRLLELEGPACGKGTFLRRHPRHPWEAFEEASQFYWPARRVGITVRSGIDCLIVSYAIRHGIPVLHHDRDVTLLARVSSLKEKRISL